MKEKMNYISIEGVSLLASDVDGCEEAEVGADAGYPVLHLLCLLDTLETFLYCLKQRTNNYYTDIQPQYQPPSSMQVGQ